MPATVTCMPGGTNRYPAVFQVGGQSVVAGAVVVEDGGLRLEGRRGAETVALDLLAESLREVRVGRSRGERLNGRPTIILARRDASDVLIGPLGVGLLSELLDLLRVLAAARTSDRLVVGVPLRKGTLERAKILIAAGPPFDPAGLQLERHDVYLRPGEALFVLQGPALRHRLEQAVRDPSFWHAGLEWSELLDGPPTLTEIPDAHFADNELLYSWDPSPPAG